MLEYFPTNYVWNLSTNLALVMGGNIGEIDTICRKLVDVSTRGDDDGTEAFFEAWCEQADRLVELAAEDEAIGRRLSAGAKHGRASTYYLTAERMQNREYGPRKAAYAKMLRSFSKFAELHEENCERVEIPYKGKVLAGLLVKAIRADGARAPCIAHFNGLDSTKEMIYGSGIAQALARRGISTLMVDQPGVGEALRLHGLCAVVESEVWAGAVVDYLETRKDIDGDRIGICAWSLGGYYAPRAAAFEKRFKLCVAWGANFNWGELQRRRLAREGDRPVPHYWEHVQWVWGKRNLDEFMAFAPQITLAHVIDKITVPFLVTHGSNDRQIPKEYAYAQYEGATNSPKRELKFFTPREGGIEHVSADNAANARDYIADWVSETFAELDAQGGAHMTRTFIDLSIYLENDVISDPPIYRPKIEYIDHTRSVPDLTAFFPGLQQGDLPDGEAWAIEKIELITHNGTHLDAPYHFASTMDQGKRAITIDEVPLEWCFQPGVKLDFRHFEDGYVVQAVDVEAELRRIRHELKPLEIVMINTAAGKRYGADDYVSAGCGMGAEATLYLLERGVRVTGTDGWSWDAPFVHTKEKYAKTHDAGLIWEGHKASRQIGYCHLEKLHNLEALPATGFTVACFPFKIRAASAGWTRAVAIFEE